MGVKLGHKRTEVGVIPDGWSSCPLGQAGQWVSGGTPSLKNPTYWSGDIPWVSPKDMKAVRLWDAIDHISYEAVSNGAKVLPAGTILLVVRGMILAHSFPVARAERPLSTNQDVKALSTREDLDSNFVLYWLIANGQRLRGLTTESSHGTKRLPTEALFEEEIAYPPLPEQRAIATALTDVDALLTQLDRLIAKKRDIKQAAMQELLTGKTRLPGFGGEWVSGRLDEVALVDPESLSGSTEPDYSFNYISLENVARGTLVGYSEELFASAPSRARRVIRHVDILVSTVRPNLKSHLLFRAKPGAWICSTGFSVIRCRPEIAHPEFVFQHLFADNITKQIDALLTGSNYPAINSSDVRGLTIPIPSIEEQTAIATLLSDLDAELAALEARRDKTRALKLGMMQELLTGRTRLV